MNPTESEDSISQRYHVPNLARALTVLEHLANSPHGQGVSEISTNLEMPKNSVFRIVTTLADHGYLHRDEDRKTYRVSRKLLALGYAAVDGGTLTEHALETMRKLRDQTGETVLIGTLSGGEGVVLEQIPSPHAVKVHVEIGHRFPLHSAAPAKAMLAFLPNGQLDSLIQDLDFQPFTPQTITTPEAYQAELAQVRRQGYALDLGEELTDLVCAAAPIWNRQGESLASIWVTGPRSRLRDEMLPGVGEKVRAAATEIMTRLGSRVPKEFLQSMS